MAGPGIIKVAVESFLLVAVIVSLRAAAVEPEARLSAGRKPPGKAGLVEKETRGCLGLLAWVVAAVPVDELLRRSVCEAAPPRL